jgi:hypothetical protein
MMSCSLKHYPSMTVDAKNKASHVVVASFACTAKDTRGTGLFL